MRNRKLWGENKIGVKQREREREREGGGEGERGDRGRLLLQTGDCVGNKFDRWRKYL